MTNTIRKYCAECVNCQGYILLAKADDGEGNEYPLWVHVGPRDGAYMKDDALARACAEIAGVDVPPEDREFSVSVRDILGEHRCPDPNPNDEVATPLTMDDDPLWMQDQTDGLTVEDFL